MALRLPSQIGHGQRGNVLATRDSDLRIELERRLVFDTARLSLFTTVLFFCGGRHERSASTSRHFLSQPYPSLPAPNPGRADRTDGDICPGLHRAACRKTDAY